MRIRRRSGPSAFTSFSANTIWSSAENSSCRAGDIRKSQNARKLLPWSLPAMASRCEKISSSSVPLPPSQVAVRERIATWEGGKGTLLEEIFSQRDAIAGSDQGKSFRAFWDFLMSPARQEEFSALLQMVFALKEVNALAPDRRLMRIHYDWLQAREVAQRTVARLSEQLRRYLDDQAWLENRRIMQLIRGVEQLAIAVRDGPPADLLMELDEPAPSIDLTMDRPLYSPPFKAKFAPQ